MILGHNIELGCEEITVPVDAMIQDYGLRLAAQSAYDSRRPAADGHHQVFIFFFSFFCILMKKIFFFFIFFND